MKKFVVGCGLLVALVVGVAVTAFILLKHRADSLGAVANQLHAQEAQYAELESKYPFVAPGAGKLVKLNDERMAAYLRVRAATLPVYLDFAARGDALSDRVQGGGKLKRMSGVLEDQDLMTELVTELQAGYLETLDKVHMSPHEFVAITEAVYSAAIGNAATLQRRALQIQIEALEQARSGAPAAMTQDLTLREHQLQATLATLPAGEDDQATMAANGPVISRAREQVIKLANPAFDAFMAHADQEFSRKHGRSPQDEGTTG